MTQLVAQLVAWGEDPARPSCPHAADKAQGQAGAGRVMQPLGPALAAAAAGYYLKVTLRQGLEVEPKPPKLAEHGTLINQVQKKTILNVQQNPSA